MEQILSTTTRRVQLDALKFGTMFIVSRALAEQSLVDMAWVKSSVLTIVGFAVFDILVANLVNLDNVNLQDELKEMVETWLKVATMMIVSRYLSGGSLQDPNWVKESLYTILGFNTFTLVTKKFMQRNPTGKLSPKAKAVVEDWLNVGTMMIVSRIMSAQSITDPTWLKGSMLTLLGFTVYDVFVAQHPKALVE